MVTAAAFLIIVNVVIVITAESLTRHTGSPSRRGQALRPSSLRHAAHWERWVLTVGRTYQPGPPGLRRQWTDSTEEGMFHHISSPNETQVKKYLLSAYYVPGYRAGDTEVSQADKKPCSVELRR